MSLPHSIPALLRAAVLTGPDRLFLSWIDPSTSGAREVSVTFSDFELTVRRAVRLLDEAGIRSGDRVLFLAGNSPAWQAVSIAVQTIRAETTALFASLGTADILDITRRVQPKAVVVGNNDEWSKLDDVLTGLGINPFVIALQGGIQVSDRYRKKSLFEIDAMEPLPAIEFESRTNGVGSEDPFVLIFTSGTTGQQKGVRLPQRAAMEAMEAAIACTKTIENDIGLHILPFAHIAGLCAFYAALKSRSRLILCSRREDLLRGFSLGPTYILLVPLIYERIRKEVLTTIEKKPVPLRKILSWSLAAAMRVASGQGQEWKDRLGAQLARLLIGPKLRRRLGGKIRLLGAGGALSEPELIAFYRGLGFDYLNFYGMSETCGVISLNHTADPDLRVDSVGRPWRGLDVKIEEDGEILVRGPTLMTGYFEREGNVSPFNKDGYFQTGDLGFINEQGYLFVTGRKKNIFVLSTGKKVSPELVELRLHQTLPVADAVLVGDGKAFISAGLFILPEDLKTLQQQCGGTELSFYLINRIREGLTGLSEYEIPKKVFVIPGSPYDHPTLMTPTLKIKRNAFAETFSSQITKIYGE